MTNDPLIYFPKTPFCDTIQDKWFVFVDVYGIDFEYFGCDKHPRDVLS